MAKSRLKELDIIRAIAFILVVNQHIIGGWSYIKTLPTSESLIMKFLYIMATPAVPIFLTISGVSLIYVYKDSFNLKKYYIKRIKYILVPYLIWSAINMYKFNDMDKFKNFIPEVLAGNGAYFLWYMGMVLRLYLYFPIILWTVKKLHKTNRAFRKILFVVQFPAYYWILCHSYGMYQKIGVILFKNPTELQQRFINISVFSWSLYFVIGIYIANYYDIFKNIIQRCKWYVLSSYCVLLTLEYLKHLEVLKFKLNIYAVSIHISFTVFSILTIYLLGLWLSQKNIVYNILKFIGDYSFAGYMLHVILINHFVGKYTILLGINDKLLLGVLVWITVSIVTPAFIAIINLIPGFNYVTGVKGKTISYKHIKELTNKVHIIIKELRSV